jgi:hypothetical protein
MLYEIITTDGSILGQFQSEKAAIDELHGYVEANRADQPELSDRLALIAIDPATKKRQSWTSYADLARVPA